MNSSDAPHRRQFVRAALATAASYGRILGANDRVRIGAIGTGGRGQYLLSQLKLAEQNDIVACCDVYEPRRLEAKSKYATGDALLYLDYREILDRKDIDAVVIGTPDHWHVPITIASVRAGKDVYCEKPVTHSIEEAAFLGRRIIVLSQRPGHVQAIVENPGMGSPAYRQTAEFHETCGHLRGILSAEGALHPSAAEAV